MIKKEWDNLFSPVTAKEETDTYKAYGKYKTDFKTYYRARQAWMNWQNFRNQRARVKRYLYGDQWGDAVRVNGKYMTERQMLEKQGIHPITSNYMYKYYNRLKGMYSGMLADPIVFARQENADVKSKVLTDTLLTNCDNDNLHDVLPQLFGELTMGGMAIVCEEWCRMATDADEDSHTIEVNPDYIGIESGGHDCQMRDISLLVEIRDYLPEDLVCELANENGSIKYTKDEIKQVYAYNIENVSELDGTQSDEVHKSVAFESTRYGYCRTYRVWTREKRTCYHVADPLNETTPLYKVETSDKEMLAAIAAENTKRLDEAIKYGMDESEVILIEVDTEHPFIDDFYMLRILSPTGVVLLEKENPYEHGMLPYSICAYEFCDGNIIPFFAHILQQQRQYNRMLTQKDTMTERALKDLKMIPYDCVPPTMSPKQFAEEMQVVGNTIFFRPSKTGALPQIISSNAKDVGFNDLLSIFRSDMEEITNENAAFQGKDPKAGTPMSRYALESENSSATFSTILKRFENFERSIYYKKLCNIQQYYTTARSIIPSQSNTLSDYAEYDPKSVGDIKFTVKIARGLNTPIARMQEDVLADQLFQMGAINPMQRVELGWTPNKAKFLQVLNTNQEQQQQQSKEG